MKLVTLLISRNKSCHVKAMHTVLKLNILCLQNGFANEIMFCPDDPYAKADTIQKILKERKDLDRLLFIDYGVHMDEASLRETVMSNYEGCGMLCFPGAVEGIDWEQFTRAVKDDTDEPNTQKGLNFDTEIGPRKIAENVYSVKQTAARAWMMHVKNVRKKLVDKPIAPGLKMFERLRDSGVKIYAYTDAKLTMTYTHEAMSNILNAAGVKVTA